MDEAAKKTALRMIPYGMYVLTTKSQDGQDVGAATVNWLTQTSFSPPLVAVGVGRLRHAPAHQGHRRLRRHRVGAEGHGVYLLQAERARW